MTIQAVALAWLRRTTRATLAGCHRLLPLGPYASRFEFGDEWFARQELKESRSPVCRNLTQLPFRSEGQVISPEQTRILLRPIHPSRVKSLDGNPYVEAHEIRAMLNRVFGFAGWSLTELRPTQLLYEQETTTKAGKPAFKVAYQSTLRLTIGQDEATYDGSAVAEAIMPDFKRGDTHDMAIKSAESQALKRAAMNMGDAFGLSLYGAGSTNALVRKAWSAAEGKYVTSEEVTSEEG